MARRPPQVFLLALALFGLGACSSAAGQPPLALPSATPSPASASSTPAAHPPAAVGDVSLVFGGDVDFDRTTRASIAAGGVDAPWRFLAPSLRSADLAMLNLE